MTLLQPKKYQTIGMLFGLKNTVNHRDGKFTLRRSGSNSLLGVVARGPALRRRAFALKEIDQPGVLASQRSEIAVDPMHQDAAVDDGEGILGERSCARECVLPGEYG
jgi:hypothetical protein